SEAFALTVTVVDIVWPFAGEVMLTVGGVVSGVGALATVTVTGAEVVRLPAASRATAVIVCWPLLVVVGSKGIEYGAVVSSAPPLTPSSWNCTPTTPTLSEAFALTGSVVDTVELLSGEVMLYVARVVAGGGAYHPAPLSFPTRRSSDLASRATAVIVCWPLLVVVGSKRIEYGAVVSSAPPLTPSSRNCTPTTPTLSEAFALTVTVVDIVWPFAGELMLTVRGLGAAATGGGAVPV